MVIYMNTHTYNIHVYSPRDLVVDTVLQFPA